MKAIIIFGYIIVSLMISGLLFIIAKLITSFYNNFIRQNKSHLDIGK